MGQGYIIEITRFPPSKWKSVVFYLLHISRTDAGLGPHTVGSANVNGIPTRRRLLGTH